MSKQCKIVQDLLPLYVDKVSSDESNKLIEAHLKECDECNKVLNILKNEEKVSNVDEKDAIKRFNKKLKRKNLKIIIITILIIILVAFLGWRLLYVNETTVKYTDNLVNVEIPEDEGIDIYINAKNYKNGYAILVKTGENTYDVYVNITQNIFTKLFKDNDKSNNLIRIGNNMCIDFQSQSVRFYIPGEAGKIENVYYVNDDYKDIVFLLDEDLTKLEDKTLVWTNADENLVNNEG